ncbi:MAG: pyruvate:ferredoxin (flavodoxin) oxidoreductase [Fibrobacterales bacterium]|nr:pyruvate:ferredoxin (flavodoxin) oxidoreductase [Fibrobacterales bacterium]
MSKKMVAMDGNEATARVAHKLSEVIAIYPITPSSPMAEHSDDWSAAGQKNIWGQVPRVFEMQSEGGAAGTVHGALQAGALTTTFTASQGLLLMIPNMYKIAGELTPTVFHVTARALAMQGLSIFGDHSDVMACRQTGFAMLASSSVQECQDLALVAHAATLESRVPFMHFFDGFRTSHEVMKIEALDDNVIRDVIDDKYVKACRERAMTPDRPTMRGTAQNPDVYFQGRETVNPFYAKVPGIVQKYMDKVAGFTGRQFHIVDYVGAPDADRVIVSMGSSTCTIGDTVKYLNSKGEKVGLVNVRLYRPFPMEAFVAALPKTVKKIAVLDRVKEPGSAGEPLFQDALTAVSEAVMSGAMAMPKMIGGRYGLSSKEFTPAMVKAIFDELSKDAPKSRFTVGIDDDVCGTSLTVDPSFKLESDFFQAMFFGLGSDGTVGANKNSIKILGNETENYAQGYFVYDSKKSGSMTTSHLRFGKSVIDAPYLIGENEADFVAIHHTPHLGSVDMLKYAKKGATVLINTPHSAETVWDTFPRPVQAAMVEKQLKVFVIDAYAVAEKTGMGRRINTVMQTCFFSKLGNVLDAETAIKYIKKYAEKTYAKKGQEVVQKNWDAIDASLANLHEVKVPAAVTSKEEFRAPIHGDAPAFVNEVTAEIIRGNGEKLPVSKMPVDGVFPTGTTKFEKRDLALAIPSWNPDACVQCGKCAMVCPHAAIRVKVVDESLLAKAPEGFKSAPAKGFKLEGSDKPAFVLSVSSYDCTGCGVCTQACIGKDKADPEKKAINMVPQEPIKVREGKCWDFFVDLPEFDRTKVNKNVVKQAMLLEPLFEFSGSCAGCGETAYVRLVSQLFGDRMVVANATGCSSIYGGNLPTTPWAKDRAGRGPAWANSLFEDNAEFGLGMRLAITKHATQALSLLDECAEKLPADLVEALKTQSQDDEAGIQAQRENVAKLKEALKGADCEKAAALRDEYADYLVKKSVWIMGGDGWAYDIGYGGLDHVMATGEDVNILVLDTEVYSNTGGQASKATNRGAVALFASAGKRAGKKDLGLIAMSYKNVYVGRVAIGANDAQALKTFQEAEAHHGPSLIIAYCPCINHGFDLNSQLAHQKMAVDSGYWPLLRYNPALAAEGKAPLVLDSKKPTIPVAEYIYTENRYKRLTRSNPEVAKKLADELQAEVDARYAFYENMAKGGAV